MPVAVSKLRAYAGLPPVQTVPDSTLQIYSDMATVIVTEDLAGKGLTDDRLDAIELNLAAHFAIISLERGGLIRQKVGASEEEYAPVNGKNSLSTTLFGQQAAALDTSGALAALTAPALRARVEVV